MIKMAKEKKYCIDCKYCEKDSYLNSYFCNKSPEKDQVTGKIKLTNPCIYERKDNCLLNILFKICGKKGRYWEPKEVKK